MRVDKRLYDLREVAEATGLALGSVRQWVSTGVIPSVALGRKRVVKAEVLEKICEEGLDTTKPKRNAVPA